MNQNERRIGVLLIPLMFYLIFKQYEVSECNKKRSLHWSSIAKKRRKKERVLWTKVNEKISDNQFRRMFRMDRTCFSSLCQHIICSVGERKFKSEAYIDAFLKGKDKMYDANVSTSGGYISGEVKVAVTLRLLAGGDALDLGVIFDISSGTITSLLTDVLMDWIIKTGIGDINMTKFLGDPDAMAKVSAGFSRRSHGVLQGAIGAIDGWLVRIVRPSLTRDGIKNVMNFFSRKGFYALNVQCIVDDKKRVIWLSYKHKGGSHDSSCLRTTGLYTFLHSIKDRLSSLGYFLLGDSAYALESFILVPYDSPSPKTAEDDFNFYHSSARITVECAFGEIDLR